MSAELEASENEMRNFNSETIRLKACLDETIEQLDVVRRENKNLAEEIKDVLEQVIEIINLTFFYNIAMM